MITMTLRIIEHPKDEPPEHNNGKWGTIVVDGYDTVEESFERMKAHVEKLKAMEVGGEPLS